MRETKVIVDIGSDTIKVVEGAVNQRNFSISRIGVVKNPVANFRLGPVPEEQEVFISFLRDYLNRLNIRSRAGVSSVAGSEVLIHYFDIPEVPPEEVESMVEVELSEVFPQGWSSLEYDFQILPSSERKTVLLAGYPRSRCNFLMQVFSQCGLRLVILDLDSLALANLYSFTAQENGGSGLVINVGARLTNMALVEKGGFVLARDIAFGGQQVTEAISRRYQCPLSEAEKVKQKPDQAAAVSQIIREISADMTSEVNTGVRYFSGRTGLKPERFLLCGGSAKLPGLKESLEEKLEIPGTLWNPLEGVPGISGETLNDGYCFAVALGLLTRKLP